MRQVEAVQLGLQAELQSRQWRAAQPQAQLRHSLVRRRHELVAALQHLPGLRAQVGQAFAAAQRRPGQRPLQRRTARQQARRQAAAGVGEVLPPAVVGHAHDLGAVAQPGARRAGVRPLHRLARAAGHAVVQQQAHLQRTAVGGLEVAELGVQTQPALGDGARGQRRVAVGRDVPVVGHRQLQAAAAVEVDARRQPTRLARLGQREAELGPGQDGHTQEAQHRAFGDALVGVEVQLHAAGFQHPVGVARTVARAAGVDRVDGVGTPAVDEVDTVGPAPGPELRELELRRQEHALEALHAQLQLGPAVDGAVAFDAHVADGAGEVLDLVVAQAVGADHGAAAAELDRAFGDGVEVGAGAQRLRAQDDGQAPGGLALRRRLEPAAGFERNRAVRRLGPHLDAAEQQRRRQGQRCQRCELHL